MFWQKAPDERMIRTLDWINDACEEKLRLGDRSSRGEVKYEALMSPTEVKIKRPGRRDQSFYWPITLLITDRWVLVGTKRGRGRRARVHKLDRSTFAANAPLRFYFATGDEIEVLQGLIPETGADRRAPSQHQR